MKRNRADGSRSRAAFALVGAAVLTVSATPHDAAAQTQEWYDREFQDNVFGVDDAVDIAYWKDGNDEWVYVTGYHTLANGATVFATSKYHATYTGPRENDPVALVFYPPRATATGTNRAVAIEVDPTNGDVYVTGESFNPNEPTGLDYVTIKYDNNLDPDPIWNANHPGAVVRWDNVGGADRPVDIALGKEHETSWEVNNVIGITGRSWGGAAPGPKYDIVTLLLDAGNGNLFTDWPDVGLGAGARSFNGSANSNDSAVGLDLRWVPDLLEDLPGLYVVVAGATRSVNSGQSGDDTLTIEYDPDGDVLVTQVINGSANGDDGQRRSDGDNTR